MLNGIFSIMFKILKRFTCVYLEMTFCMQIYITCNMWIDMVLCMLLKMDELLREILLYILHVLLHTSQEEKP